MNGVGLKSDSLSLLLYVLHILYIQFVGHQNFITRLLCIIRFSVFQVPRIAAGVQSVVINLLIEEISPPTLPYI